MNGRQVYSSTGAGRVGRPGRLPGSRRRGPIREESRDAGSCGAASVVDEVVGTVSDVSAGSSSASVEEVASVEGSVTPGRRLPRSPGGRGRRLAGGLGGAATLALGPTCRRGRLRNLVSASAEELVVVSAVCCDKI